MLWDWKLSKPVKSTHVKFREDVFCGSKMVVKAVEELEMLPWPEMDEHVDENVHDDNIPAARKSS